MKQIVLDTNFILSCVRNKLDFLEEISFMGIKILIPKEVTSELEKISVYDKRTKFREEAKLAIKILNTQPLEIITLKNKNVDKGIINYAKKNNTLVASLDQEIKKKFKGKTLLIRDRKKLEIV